MAGSGTLNQERFCASGGVALCASSSNDGTSFDPAISCGNPSHASGVARTYVGETKAALAHFARSRQLNPLDTAAYAYWTAIATTHFFAGNYGAAHDALAKALLDWPDAPTALRLNAAVCSLLERDEEARGCAQRLRALIPDTTIEITRAHVEPFTAESPRVLQALLHGLRQSGLPEGATHQAKVTRLRSV